MGQKQCCQQDAPPEALGEVLPHDEYYPDSYTNVRGFSPLGIGGGSDERCRCFRNSDFPTEAVAVAGSQLESLSYEPVRFDVSQTVDVERSQARYTNIVVHSTRARTQRRAQTWEHWLRAATAGRPVTLLTSFDRPKREDTGTDEEPVATNGVSKVAATYRLDSGLTKFSITAVEAAGSAVAPIGIAIDSIQVICPATDFMLFFDQVEAQLDELEQKRAVMLQYQAPEGQRMRICFLEESEHAKDRFVQALTALWLEKRSDHSMWF